MSSKVETCVLLEACDSITRGKSVRHVLRGNKSQMVCVSIVCSSPLITKYVKHLRQINTQIRVTRIPDVRHENILRYYGHSLLLLSNIDAKFVIDAIYFSVL